MNNSGNKKMYAGLDVGKFVCAFLILFYHYFSEHGPLPGILDEALSLYAIAVALFMTISGFLLFDKLETVVDTRDRWKIVKKQVIRIYTVYLVWSVPYLLFTVLRWDWNSITFKFIFWQIQEWIFKSTFYTIWFMPVLAIGLILTFWLTEKLPQKIVIFLSIICYLIGSLLLTYNFIGLQIPGFNIFSDFAETWLGGARGWLFYAFPLIMLGRFMVKKKEQMKPFRMGILSCLCVILMLGEALLIRFLAGRHTGIDLTLMMIPTVFCLLGLLISVSLPARGVYRWMRNMSTLIFMSQRIFLTVLPACFPAVFDFIFLNNYIGSIIIGVLVVGFSGIIICASRKISFLKKLY